MDNKKTAVFLVIFLAILIALMFLRACGIGPWSSVNVKNVKPEPAKPENFVVEKDTNTVEIAAEAVIDPQTVVNAEEEVKPPVELPQEDVKPEPPVTPKPKPADKPKPKPKPVVKTETSKADLPKPAVQKPKREKAAMPVFTNKSGFKPFYVYSDIGTKDNHYSPYGFMGDVNALTVDQGWKVNPQSGISCIKVIYEPANGRVGWAGVYWTEPPNNWGDKGFGFNLAGAERISFWAKGEKGGEVINNFIMGGIQGKECEDSDSRAIGPIELSTEWKQFFVDIEDADLANIIGGFCFTVTKNNNPLGAVFYLDNIVYE
ncbi:MAG: hypothetical protein FWH43_06250 [Endomicrobia bacterium]|nr:hypothetical protein [Endomicrobiia bacterium]